MTQHNALPGTFPTTQTKTIAESKQRLGLKSQFGKLKAYFHSNEQKLTVEKVNKISKWKTSWSKKTKQVCTSNTVAVGTVFSLNVPITISNTTTHYNSKTKDSTRAGYSSVVQQFVILPPLQIYGFMFLVTLFLFIIAFALLQVHRTISIIELAVDGIKYTLVNFTNVLSVLKSWV